jgi:hypothetical protein
MHIAVWECISRRGLLFVCAGGTVSGNRNGRCLALVTTLLGVGALTGSAADAGVIVAADFGQPASPVESGFQAQTGNTQTYTGIGDLASGQAIITFTAGANRDRAAPTSGASPDLYRDLFTALSETQTNGVTLSISGLDPSTTYSLEIWSLDRGFNNGATYEWRDTTDPASPVLLGTITNSTSAVPASLSEFRVTANVTSDATGTIRLGHNDSAGTGTINGLRISTVPEPTSAALVGVGGLGLLARRRRRYV